MTDIQLRRRHLLALGAALLPAGCKKKAPAGPKTYRIAVIPKGTTHEFWKSVRAGAEKAVADLTRELAPTGSKVEMIWKGPLREDDREQQIQVVEGFTAQGVDGIVLAPLDKNALARPVEEAARVKIPTVVIDSALNSPEIVSTVSTDNHRGGELAAMRMGGLLPAGGHVLVLPYAEGSASTEAREAGFIDRIRSYPDIRVVSADQHAGPTRDTAKRTAENLLNQFGKELKGIFCSCEPTAMGTLLALEDLGLAGKIILVGFDATAAFVQALGNKHVHGFVVQDPAAMGETGVRTLMDHLRGKTVPREIPTEAVMVTSEVLADPKVARLLPKAG